MYRILLLSLLLSACGKFEVDVNHKIQIDLDNLDKYFRASCQKEQPQDIDECVDNRINEFLNLVLG